METLIVIVIMLYAVRHAVSDVSYAVRGQTPPRVKVRLARLDKGLPDRYGLSGYLADLWSDAWKHARERREARRANGTPERKPGVRRYLATRWNDAWEAAEAKRRDARAAKDERPADDPEPQAPATDAAPADSEPPADEDLQDQQNADAQRPETPAPRLASVTPIRTTKEEPVNSINGETTTLTAAKQYATDMANAASSAVASVEQTVAHLSTKEVTGDSVARFNEAQELAAALEAKFREAHDALARQDAVKDAYQSVPDAGSKDFVTGE